MQIIVIQENSKPIDSELASDLIELALERLSKDFFHEETDLVLQRMGEDYDVSFMRVRDIEKVKYYDPIVSYIFNSSLEELYIKRYTSITDKES